MTKATRILKMKEGLRFFPPLSRSSGAIGDQFENIFLQVCEFLGLDFFKRQTNGSYWDFKPLGLGWSSSLRGRIINIKVSTAQQLFTDVQFMKMLPWMGLPRNWHKYRMEEAIKQYLLTTPFPDVLWLKPSTVALQQMFVSALAQENDVILRGLLSSPKYFLGTIVPNFSIEISSNEVEGTFNGFKIILPNGRVFARAKPPRRGSRVDVKHDYGTSTASLGYKPLQLISWW